MWQFSPPTAVQLEKFRQQQAKLPFSYLAVGATQDAPPEHFDVDANAICLGQGNACFTAAAMAMRQWSMFPRPWTRIDPADAPITAGTTVVLVAHVFGVWWLNACRIVYTIHTTSPWPRFGFAYGTLPAHVEQGEERFLIEQCADGSVWYRLDAFSRPHYWLTRLAYPLTRWQQRRFARLSLQSMVQAVQGNVVQTPS